MPLRDRNFAFLFWALMLLVLPLPWICAAFAATAMHELGHVSAVYACGGRIKGFSFDHRGARLEAADLSWGKRIVCILAGPLAGAMLCLLYRSFPRVAVCAFLQTVYNLMPVEPLDGGRVLRCLLGMFLPPQKAQRVCAGVRRCFFGLLMGMFFFCFCFLRVGFLGVLPILMVLIRLFSEKDLALAGVRRYNSMEHPLKEYSYERITAADPAWRTETGTVYRRRI
jgi:stage IV sporulation protein FB